MRPIQAKKLDRSSQLANGGAMGNGVQRGRASAWRQLPLSPAKAMSCICCRRA